MLKLNCYNCLLLHVQAARIMPCDSVLRSIKYSKTVSQSSTNKYLATVQYNSFIQLYYELNRHNVASLLAMNGANKYMGQSRRS